MLLHVVQVILMILIVNDQHKLQELIEKKYNHVILFQFYLDNKIMNDIDDQIQTNDDFKFYSTHFMKITTTGC
jgi:hypothetical protein